MSSENFFNPNGLKGSMLYFILSIVIGFALLCFVGYKRDMERRNISPSEQQARQEASSRAYAESLAAVQDNMRSLASQTNLVRLPLGDPNTEVYENLDHTMFVFKYLKKGAISIILTDKSVSKTTQLEASK